MISNWIKMKTKKIRNKIKEILTMWNENTWKKGKQKIYTIIEGVIRVNICEKWWLKHVTCSTISSLFFCSRSKDQPTKLLYRVVWIDLQRTKNKEQHSTAKKNKIKSINNIIILHFITEKWTDKVHTNINTKENRLTVLTSKELLHKSKMQKLIKKKKSVKNENCW